MRIYKIVLALVVVSVLILTLPTSCSKTGYTIVSTTADSAVQIITANDELNVSYEFDQVLNEALLATSVSCIAGGDSVRSGAGPVLYTTLSNVIIDTSHIADSSLIRLTYYGKNADQSKGRSGTATLHFSRDINGKIIPWKTPGATINITFNQYEVILLSNNKSLWMNGTAVMTNSSGGLLKKVANIALQPGDSLQDRVNANIIFTYNDNSNIVLTWTWNITQVRMFNIQNAVLTSTIRGDSTIGTASGVSTSGNTRLGSGFYTRITAPVVQTIPAPYLLSNPISGQKKIEGIPEPLTIDYGVDNHGIPVQSGSPYGYKISWTANGGQAICIVKY